MNKSDLKNINLPDAPGVYFFRDAKDEILYIGKATSLRSRVRSYFSDDLIATRGPLLVDMVTKSSTVTHQETDSVLEALILESALIKQHQPVYNSREKDDKSYWYVVITDEDFPRVFIDRKTNIDYPESLKYKIKKTYGPYPSASSIKEALRIIRKIFPFRSKKSGDKYHDRFYEQLGLTTATGEGSEARKRYQQLMRHVGLFFQGKKSAVINELEKEMIVAAKSEDFEYAQVLRNRIWSLQHINDVSLIDATLVDQARATSDRIEAYDIAHMDGKNMIGVMTVLSGNQPDSSQYRLFNIRLVKQANDPQALSETLVRRFGHGEWAYPNLIVMDGGEIQYNLAKRFLASKNLENTIDVVSVVKDERHQPKDILGNEKVIEKYGREAILLANNEAHRFALKNHKAKRRKNFLKK